MHEIVFRLNPKIVLQYSINILHMCHLPLLIVHIYINHLFILNPHFE